MKRPLIFEQSGPPSKPFNALQINLLASLESPLKWDEEKKRAEEWASKGYRILWNLQLGLFHHLALPLSDTAQFRSLRLGLEVFCDEIYSSFKEATLGATLFSGSLDLSCKFPFDLDQRLALKTWLHEKYPSESFTSTEPADLEAFPKGQNLLRLYCMEEGLEYLQTLTASFADEVKLFLAFDASAFDSPLMIHQLLDDDLLEDYTLILKGPLSPDRGLSWGEGKSELGFLGSTYTPFVKETPRIGLVLPDTKIIDPEQFLLFDRAFYDLKRKEKPFKVLTPRKLTETWEMLDILILNPAHMGSETKRKLKGFELAGGEVHLLSQP